MTITTINAGDFREMNISRLFSHLSITLLLGSLFVMASNTVHAQEWVQLLYPNGPVHEVPDLGECDSSLLYRDGHYYSGDTIHILWDASSDVQAVTLSYSSDDGLSWITLAKNIPVADQPYIWVAPERDGDTTNGWKNRMKVASSQASDTSDKTIAINARPFVHLRYPNGGETLVAGSDVKVQWESGNVNQYWLVGRISFDYSSDGGATWNDAFFNGTAREGEATWSVPAEVSGPILLRAYGGEYREVLFGPYCLTADEAYGYYGDTSDAPITITASSGVSEDAMPAPDELTPVRITPNPVDHEGLLRWMQGSASTVIIRLFDATGSTVRTIDVGYRERGEQSVTIIAGDLPVGMYWCEIQAGLASSRGALFVVR